MVINIGQTYILSDGTEACPYAIFKGNVYFKNITDSTEEVSPLEDFCDLVVEQTTIPTITPGFTEKTEEEKEELKNRVEEVALNKEELQKKIEMLEKVNSELANKVVQLKTKVEQQELLENSIESKTKEIEDINSNDALTDEEKNEAIAIKEQEIEAVQTDIETVKADIETLEEEIEEDEDNVLTPDIPEL